MVPIGSTLLATDILKKFDSGAIELVGAEFNVTVLVLLASWIIGMIAVVTAEVNTFLTYVALGTVFPANTALLMVLLQRYQ